MGRLGSGKAIGLRLGTRGGEPRSQLGGVSGCWLALPFFNCEQPPPSPPSQGGGGAPRVGLSPRLAGTWQSVGEGLGSGRRARELKLCSPLSEMSESQFNDFFFKASTIGPISEIELFWVHSGVSFPQGPFRALWGPVWLSGRQGFGHVEVGQFSLAGDIPRAERPAEILSRASLHFLYEHEGLFVRCEKTRNCQRLQLRSS